MRLGSKFKLVLAGSIWTFVAAYVDIPVPSVPRNGGTCLAKKHIRQYSALIIRRCTFYTEAGAYTMCKARQGHMQAHCTCWKNRMGPGAGDAGDAQVRKAFKCKFRVAFLGKIALVIRYLVPRYPLLVVSNRLDGRIDKVWSCRD